MTTRVIIVRHGQSTYNAQQLIQGRCDESVLTEKGQAQAKTVAASLAGLKFDAIYSSPLQRARATADLIQQNLGTAAPQVTTSENLREIDLPLWEKMPRPAVAEKFPEQYQIWHDRPAELMMELPDGTKHYPVVSLYHQAQTFWEETIPHHDGQTILIVAHNGINRCLLMSAIGTPPEYYQNIHQSNCCINVLNFTGGWGDQVQLESLNQTFHMGQPLPPLAPNHQGLRLLLVRHGETDWNREGRFQGIRDIPLNDHGRHQARQAAEFLKEIPIDCAASSPLSRPKETAEIILQHHGNLEISLYKDLTEICHGLWEGKLKQEIEQEYPGMLAEWESTPETVQMPDGENLQDVWDRCNACWDQIVVDLLDDNPTKIALVTAHDAVNKVIIARLLGLNPADIWAIKQGNGAVTVIDYPQGLAGQPVLQAINITSHLGGVIDQTAAGAL